MIRGQRILEVNANTELGLDIKHKCRIDKKSRVKIMCKNGRGSCLRIGMDWVAMLDYVFLMKPTFFLIGQCLCGYVCSIFSLSPASGST